MDPFIGQIMMFGGSFAPRGWAFCDGQLLAISSNSALFSIIGTTYGGDGRTTFALPDLRGRAPIHAGTGPGLSTRRLGSKGGEERVTLNTTEIPSHSHNMSSGTIAVGAEGKGVTTSDTAVNNFIGNSEGAFRTTSGGGNLGASLNGNTGAAGGNLSHDNMSPFGVVNYIIALQGVFPSRS
ncbi:phage tail protein [Portibacter marinus]|uniref:phage tail protein n=1 Tax=Portibacter marinus TaxID=2898660 RepID=UPI001F2B05F8|nr:tail fiber protein [Portibacter marinus]